MSVNKIEGVPAGWELVRIDKANKHEFYLDACGEPRLCRWGNETAMGCAIVREIELPKPTYIPWTFDTCPLGVEVRRKGEKFRGQLSAAGESGAVIAGGHYAYALLLADFERDGTPCGTLEESQIHDSRQREGLGL